MYTNIFYYIFVDHTLTNLVYKNTWINVSNKLLNVYTRVIEIAVLGETIDTIQIQYWWG